MKIALILKQIFLGLLALAVLFSCSSTPAIKTHHKTIPSKKVFTAKPESAAAESMTAPSVITPTPMSPVISSNELTPSAAATTSAVELAPVTNATENFNLSEERKEKPRSSITYDSKAQKIGVILPITGKYASLGQRALNAVRMGLGLHKPDPYFSIAIYDSQSNPDKASLGVEKLLRDDNVIAILGGLSAKEAQGISAQAEFFEVPFISFSQKSGLTIDADYTFRNSVTPEMQAESLVRYALNQLKAQRFAILYPNDPYGVEFANKFWDLVLAGGGQVTAAQYYDPKDKNLNPYVQKLLGTYYLDARPAEYEARKKELAEKKRKKKELEGNKKKSARDSEAQENILPPIVDFDVLFVPDSGSVLGQVMAFMKNNDVMQMTYLGTNLWNTPDLPRRTSGYNNNLFFVDASITPEEQKKSQFHAEYFATYQEEPTLIEAQFFEAAKILQETIGRSSISRSSLASQLSSLGRRNGAYNEIRMNNQKEIQRPLSIFSLVEGSIQKAQ